MEHTEIGQWVSRGGLVAKIVELDQVAGQFERAERVALAGQFGDDREAAQHRLKLSRFGPVVQQRSWSTAKSVTATFTLAEYDVALTITGSGTGSVTSTPSAVTLSISAATSSGKPARRLAEDTGVLLDGAPWPIPDPTVQLGLCDGARCGAEETVTTLDSCRLGGPRELHELRFDGGPGSYFILKKQ